MKKKSFLFLATILLGFMSSCRKEAATDPIFSSSEDNVEVSALFDDIDVEVDNVSQFKSDMIINSTSPTGTRDTVVTDSAGLKVLVITYNNYVNGLNTRIKNGKIIVVIEGKYADFANPFRKVITFQNFTINGNKIEGVRTIARDANDTKKYNITLENAKVTFINDQSTYTRTLETRVRTWIKGYDTPYWILDDEYTITGSARGTNKKGEAYTHTISTPLEVSPICPWIKAGVIEFSLTRNSEVKTAIINYGDGSCDNAAIVTIAGKEYNIKLKGNLK